MMEVKTQALMEGEESLRRANAEMRRVCEELDSVARVIGSMKSIELSRLKIRSIENNIEELASAVSQMACFLEMAKATYTKTELNIEEKSHINSVVIGWKTRIPQLTLYKRSDKIAGFDSDTLFKSIKWK